ncbi:MAG: hypothetical protein LBC04_00560 [Holosporaceae bacterium]|nr:hypothetical protein [Holosporaceae bacterium]
MNYIQMYYKEKLKNTFYKVVEKEINVEIKECIEMIDLMERKVPPHFNAIYRRFEGLMCVALKYDLYGLAKIASNYIKKMADLPIMKVPPSLLEEMRKGLKEYSLENETCNTVSEGEEQDD